MSDEKPPYVNRMDVLHGPLERIDVRAVVDACTDRWFNQTLCRVDDAVVRLGILEGEYHWHSHEREDEFFFTLEGRLLVDLEGCDTVALEKHQGFVVPRGVAHRTRAPEKTVVLMIETETIVPTGS
jgi:mannose-6-phosphate isomerase-like protein (cupin superfamily)